MRRRIGLQRASWRWVVSRSRAALVRSSASSSYHCECHIRPKVLSICAKCHHLVKIDSVFSCAHECALACAYACVRACVGACVCVCVCLCVCACRYAFGKVEGSQVGTPENACIECADINGDAGCFRSLLQAYDSS